MLLYFICSSMECCVDKKNGMLCVFSGNNVYCFRKFMFILKKSIKLEEKLVELRYTSIYIIKTKSNMKWNIF